MLDDYTYLSLIDETRPLHHHYRGPDINVIDNEWKYNNTWIIPKRFYEYERLTDRAINTIGSLRQYWYARKPHWRVENPGTLIGATPPIPLAASSSNLGQVTGWFLEVGFLGRYTYQRLFWHLSDASRLYNEGASEGDKAWSVRFLHQISLRSLWYGGSML